MTAGSDYHGVSVVPDIHAPGMDLDERRAGRLRNGRASERRRALGCWWLLLIDFDPQPEQRELPARLPSPFASGPPHPLASRAAERLKQQLRRREVLAGTDFDGVHRGKMFGVLVVVDGAGRVGYLQGFSGMVDGNWQTGGFVGPLFDPAQRDAVWPAGEAELVAFD